MKIKDKSYLSIFYLFLFWLIFNCLLLTLGIIFYPEKFFFWQYPFSYIGTVKSVNGLDNFYSLIIYSTNMVISAFFMLVIFFVYFRQKIFLLDKITLLGVFGFLIAAFSPDDTKHELHMLGSALSVAALWLIVSYYLLINRKKIEKIKYYFLQAFFQIPIIIYAMTVFLDLNPWDGLWQKISFFILGFMILYLTYFYPLKNFQKN